MATARPPSGRFTVSSATFNIHSEVDNLNFDFSETREPACRDKIITQPRISRSRISGVSLSSSQEISPHSRQSSKLSNTHENRRGNSISQTTIKSTQKPYLSSSRVHKCPSFNEAIRADVMLAASRQYEDHTTGSYAQVPVAYRQWNSNPQQTSVTSLPLPVIPVRGNVVLTSLRSQPTPPTNSVRTRAKGELVYNGPSYLLREHAAALNHQQNHHQQQDSNTDETQNSQSMEKTQLYQENNQNSLDNTQIDSSSKISQATDLSFVSVFGTPQITTVTGLEETYSVMAPPDHRTRFRKSSTFISRNDPELSSSASTSASTTGSPKKHSTKKFAKMPRFPIN